MSAFNQITAATIIDTNTFPTVSTSSLSSNLRTTSSKLEPSSSVLITSDGNHPIEQSNDVECVIEANESETNEVSIQINTLTAIRQMFKVDEVVIMVLEVSKNTNDKQPNHVLALVNSESCGTYAIFSLSTAAFPSRDRSDLSIDKIFPLNNTFKLNSDSNSTSLIQLMISNSDTAPTLYYYQCITSDQAVDYNKFQANLNIVTKSMWPSGDFFSFSWLDDYREIGEVKQELKRREKEYITHEEIKIYCATWNVNDKSCYESELQLWLRANGPADIYVIGLQELDTSAKSILAVKPDQNWISKWLSVIGKNNTSKFVELCSKRFFGMMITVIVREEIHGHIQIYSASKLARGFYNTIGNKGCVAISLKLYEDYICFINSHLAANLDAVEMRNEDYAAIVNKLYFEETRLSINEHDLIFWIGDLNYRIDEPGGIVSSIERSDNESYKRLLPFDQLRIEQSKGKCFDGYKEAPILFRPTYKYDIGTDRFDSEKQRAPAYCDRVLWKGDRIENLCYNCVMEMRQSDHKPVYAVFSVKIRKRDEVIYKRVHEEVLKLVDKRENENQPQISVDHETIDFGKVQFNEIVVRKFKVMRNCSTSVDFMFKAKTSNRICEKWLQIEPMEATLLNDNPQTILVKFLADARSIAELLKQIQSDNLKYGCDILVLHVKNGRDIFITVKCEYQPSCFGLSMETLCRTDRPLGTYTQLEIHDLMNSKNSKYRITMPREFFMLIDFLHRQGVKATGAFNASSIEYNHTQVAKFNDIRDWLDEWSREDFPGTPQAAAEALLLLLDLPEEPLLSPFTKDLLQVECRDEAREYIDKLSSPNKNVFIHLCMFLREGILKNYYESSDIVSIFGRVIFRNERNNPHCKRFLMQFICPDFED